ncbi:ROK family protein [Nocardioides sp.]|uniref:ROK family protein n=1 Tax=Nocardioides sp. TaxID=35761 RepID=UPI0035111C73
MTSEPSQPPESRSAPWIGVDIGGTKVLAGEIDDAGRLVRTASRPTPGARVPLAEVEAALDAAVAEVAQGRTPAGVGVAVAGLVDPDGERVMFAPHLPWAGEPVRARLEERWGVPVAVDNDANCAARGEARFGAARGRSSALLVALGTGIGGAYVLDGRVLRGAGGMAGEFGHMSYSVGGRACPCGLRGCWEQYCSGRALVRAAREHLPAPESLLHRWTGGRPSRLDGPMITDAAQRDDAVALAAYRDIGVALGRGVASLVAALDPEVVVIGGGVSVAGEPLLAPARQALATHLVGASHRTLPPLLPATLGNAAGIVGAALLLRD